MPEFAGGRAQDLARHRQPHRVGHRQISDHEDLIAAFTLRSKRLVVQEAVGQFIAEAEPDEKIDRILFVEDNIIGAENKRQLSNYILPVLNSAAFEKFSRTPRSLWCKGCSA